MPCVTPDGTLTETAKALLKLTEQPTAPEDIAAGLGLPLFLIRASLRELVNANLLRVEGGKYVITEEGGKRV